MQTRIVRRKPVISTPILGIHPILERIYQHRGITSTHEVDHTLTRLLPFDLLSGIDKAVALLSEALAENWRILVVGDFDADGATSTAVAIKALSMMGATDIDFLVPNRLTDGYGLTPEIVKKACAKKPDLIITVDNGISSLAGVQTAQSLGIRVCITDHHLPGLELPPAEAIVNPNLPGDLFPSKCLAGVGVIFYVMLALRSSLRKSGWFQKKSILEPNLACLLDIVALGTVADVVPLDTNNRILVHQGLQRIKAGAVCPGIQALLEVAGRFSPRLSAVDLGFTAAPRLNAAGRLEDMSVGIACLLSNTLEEARTFAAQLNRLNSERREIEEQMKSEAMTSLSDFVSTYTLQELPAGLCVFQEDWHPGVIGILASRLKDKFHRPVIAFAPGLADEIKGSARSIPGVHIRDVLQTLATQNPDLIERFGGHAMAAGLTLARAQFEKFCVAFDAAIKSVIPVESLQRQIWTDGELSQEDFTLEVASLLKQAGPWGQGFPEPTFDGTFQVLDKRIVGEKHLKMTVAPAGSTAAIDAIFFHYDFREPDPFAQPVQLAYRLDVNEYQGMRRVQLLVDEVLPAVL